MGMTQSNIKPSKLSKQNKSTIKKNKREKYSVETDNISSTLPEFNLSPSYDEIRQLQSNLPTKINYIQLSNPAHFNILEKHGSTYTDNDSINNIKFKYISSNSKSADKLKKLSTATRRQCTNNIHKIELSDTTPFATSELQKLDYNNDTTTSPINFSYQYGGGDVNNNIKKEKNHKKHNKKHDKEQDSELDDVSDSISSSTESTYSPSELSITSEEINAEYTSSEDVDAKNKSRKEVPKKALNHKEKPEKLQDVDQLNISDTSLSSISIFKNYKNKSTSKSTSKSKSNSKINNTSNNTKNDDLKGKVLELSDSNEHMDILSDSINTSDLNIISNSMSEKQ